MEKYAPVAKDLASRDVVSRAMTIEILEGRWAQNPLYFSFRAKRSGTDVLVVIYKCGRKDGGLAR